MAKFQPWLKMWVEWIDDPKMLSLTLAEQAAWWRLITLAKKCAADGYLVKGPGSPLSLDQIADAIRIITKADRKVYDSMVEKMIDLGSLHLDNDTLIVTHFAARQAKTTSETPEAVRDRVRRHRERQRQHVTENPLQELGEEIREALLNLPTYSSYIAEHEAVKDTLHELGLKKGYISRAEVTIPSGRVDLIWANEHEENIAAFEIDARLPKWKSIVKLRALSCPQSFVILRAGTTPFSQEGNITLIGLARPRLKELKNDGQDLPTPPLDKDKEIDTDVEADVTPLHSVTRNAKSVTSEPALAKIAILHEQHFGIITPGLAEKFKDFVENYSGSVDWIELAFAEAVKYGVRRWQYVETILYDWQEKGGPDANRRQRGKGNRPGAPRVYTREDAEKDGWSVTEGDEPESGDED